MLGWAGRRNGIYLPSFLMLKLLEIILRSVVFGGLDGLMTTLAIISGAAGELFSNNKLNMHNLSIHCVLRFIDRNRLDMIVQ